MGNAGNKAREIKGKPKTGKRINQQKIETAGRTGILSLKESKLRTIPDPVFSLLNLKVQSVTRFSLGVNGMVVSNIDAL